MNYTYQFYPCGRIPKRFDNNMLYIRYKSAKERNEFTRFSAFSTTSGAVVDCPDRELFFERNTHISDSDRPLRGWDKAVSMSMLYSMGDDFPENRYMINHTAFSSAEKNLEIRSRMHTPLQTKKIIISDSGGFQLRSGKEHWIDPVGLAEFYNTHADEGVTLDIPVTTYKRELLERAVKVQKNNSKKIIEHLDPEVRLANVTHGVEYDDFIFYREKLWEDERMDILCIPSSAIIPDVQSMDRLAYHLSHGMRYRQYHLLGIYNMTWLSIAIKAVTEYNKTLKQPILLTSDASSSIYSAMSFRYHLQPMAYKSVSRWPLGLSAPVVGKYHLPSKKFACHCPVCENIGYVDALTILGDINAATYLTRHNEIETIRWTSLMCEAAEQMDMKTYRDFCNEQTGRKSHRGMMMGFDYLESFLQDGWEKTHTRFKGKINNLFGGKPPSDALFEGSRDTLAPNESVVALNKHLDAVLKRYERYHKTGKPPVKVKKNQGKSFFDMMGASSYKASKKRRANQ